MIGATGEQLGIVSKSEAIRLAEDSGLDLVEVASTASPIVCKIMDFGKLKYDQKKTIKHCKIITQILSEKNQKSKKTGLFC